MTVVKIKISVFNGLRFRLLWLIRIKWPL